MFYVEWLRLRNCLRVLGIVLGILFALAVIVRLFMPTQLTEDQNRWISDEMGKPGVHSTTTRLADGSTQTTVIDPDGDHFTIVDRGWHGKSVTVSGPDVDVDRHARVRVGPLGVDATSGRNGGVVRVSTDEPVPLETLLIAPLVVGLIIATILGGVLAKENRNHLEIVWTKPVNRDAMALGLFAVDALGIAGAMVATFLFEVLGIALYELPNISVGSQTLGLTLLALFSVLAFYSVFNAASAMVRGGGGIKALVWLTAIFVPAISAAALVPVLIFHIVGNLFGALAVLDPLAYLNHDSTGGSGVVSGVVGSAVLSAPVLDRAGVLALLVVFYCGLSLLQWRRLEA